MTNHLDLDTLVLESGGHSDTKDAFCVMEAVAYFNHEPWSDHPECASPVITAFLVHWNDSLNDEDRQRLKRFIPMVVGTRTTPEDEEVRAWLATDWLVRTFTPVWLDRAGLTEDAAAMRKLEALTSTELAQQAQPIIDAARKKSAAARDASWAAARDASWAAARDAARDAAGDAAGDAARDAARDAAGAAARDAAGAAARDAAWAAAGAAAGDAAGAAAWDAAGDAAGAAAWDAAWAAAWAAAWDAASKKKGYVTQYDAAYKAARTLLDEAFADTITELQQSAEELLERMIAVRKVPA